MAGRTAGNGFKKIGVKSSEKRKYILFSDAETSKQDGEEDPPIKAAAMINSDDEMPCSAALKLKQTRVFADQPPPLDMQDFVSVATS